MSFAPLSPAPTDRAARGSLRIAQSALSIAGGLVAWVVLLGPLLALIWHLSPHALVAALRAPDAFGPAGTSLAASAVALVIVVAVGTPVALVIAERGGAAARVLEASLLVVLLMPPLVIGLLLVFMAGPLTPVGAMLAHVGLSATNTFTALVIAEVYEAAPYFVLAAAAAFAAADHDVVVQARLLGDTAWRAFWRVMVPEVAAELATALSIAWARAIGAFGAVIIVAYHPYGLPLQIWTTLNETGLAAALPYAIVLLVVALPFPLLAYARGRHARR